MFGISLGLLIYFLVWAACAIVGLYFLARGLWARWKIHKEDTRE